MLAGWTLVLAGCQDNNVNVIADQSPEVSITSPIAGEVILESLPVELVGSVYDPDTLNEDLEIYWEDSIEGQLIGDIQLEHNDVRLTLADGFEAGEHTLTLVARDPNSTTEQAQVTFTVAPNTPPEVQIISPSDGATLSTATSQTIVAAVSDEHTPVEDLILIWESTRDGELSGTEDVIGNTITFEPDPALGEGDHTLTLKAFDPLGDWGEDSIDVTVGSTSPPEITFSYPDGSTVYERNDEVFFQIQVDDDQVDLSAIRLDWTGFNELDWANEKLPAHPTSSGVASFSVLLDCTQYDNDNPSQFVLTAIATDDDGQSGQQSVFFDSYCEPID